MAPQHLNQLSRAVAAASTQSTPSASGHLLARNLSHTFYRDQIPVEALRGVNLDIPAGSQVSIMGPSGSGKSTLLHALAGILQPTGGQVWLDGTEITALKAQDSSRVRLRHCGFVFQDGQLLPELSNEENVALPLMLGGVTKGNALRAARTVLANFGLEGLERYRPGQLSGGQAQRVAIARAIVTRPSVVFADEPTGALDQGTGAQVMEALTQACRANQTTLVLVTHDHAVARWLQYTIHMRDGQIETVKGEQ